MRASKTQLDSFNGGGYNNEFKLVMDTGMIIDEVVLKTQNLDADQVPLIEMRLNGDPIVSLSGQDLLDYRKAKGLPDEANKFRIPFKDITVLTDTGQNMSSLVTNMNDNLVLVVRAGAAKQTQIDGGKVPALSGYCELRSGRDVNGKEIPRVFLPRMRREIAGISITGENNIKTLPKGPAIQMAMFKDEGHMSRLRIKRNRLEILNIFADDNLDDLKNKVRGFAGVSGYFIFNPLASGFAVYDMLQTASQSLEFMPTVDDPSDIEVLLFTLEVAANPSIDPLTLILNNAK